MQPLAVALRTVRLQSPTGRRRPTALHTTVEADAEEEEEWLPHRVRVGRR